MKIKVIICCVSMLGTALFCFVIVQPQAGGSPESFPTFRYGVMSQGMVPGIIPPQIQSAEMYSAQPFMPAQQVCSRQAGWQWRPSGFAMCFHPGNLPCPQGHPWTRRTTEHYTVCLSMENPAWVFPESMVY